MKIKVPGKLFILGEYFVMEPGQNAVVMAADRFLYAEIKENDSFYFKSEYGSFQNYPLEKVDSKLKLAHTSFEIAEEYIQLFNIPMTPFRLVIKSGLQYDNLKIGLGSSGAVIVAILKSIFNFHNVKVSKETLFKLSVICQYRSNHLSSGADIAASVYGGLVHYCRYDYSKISFRVEDIEEKWPCLRIEKINSSLINGMKVFWTEKSFDTQNAINSLYEFKVKNRTTYLEFQKKAQNYVKMFIDEGNLESIYLYRQLMSELENYFDYEIEPPEFSQEMTALSRYSKMSGSGGGDCFISFYPNLMNKKSTRLLGIGVFDDEIEEKR